MGETAHRTAGGTPALQEKHYESQAFVPASSCLDCWPDSLLLTCQAPAGGMPSTSGYTILTPIRQGNLSVFPVVAARSFDTAGLPHARRRPAFGRSDCDRVRKCAAADAPAANTRPAPRRTGQSIGSGQQLQAATDPAGGRDCDWRQAGPRDRQGPYYPGRERSRRSRCLLRGAWSLGGQQRQIRGERQELEARCAAPMAAPSCPR